MTRSRPAVFGIAVIVAAAIFVLVDDPDTAAPPPPPTRTDTPAAHLDSLDPPGDLEAAREVAARLAAALVTDDRATVKELAAPPLAQQLGNTATTSVIPASGRKVETTLVRDAQRDAAVVDVILRSHQEGAVEVVTTALARTSEGWRAVDVAF